MPTDTNEEQDSDKSAQQTDWTIVGEYFEKPHLILEHGMTKVLHEVVKGAVNEMRRYYSRKVVDVLIKVTKHSLDTLLRRFSVFGKN